MADLHDGIFRTSFSDPRAVEGFAEMTFPKSLLAKINLKTLKPEPTTFLDDNFRKYYSDMVYSCETKEGENVLLNFVFEHKSYLPDNPELQLLLYMALGYAQQKRVQKEQKKKGSLTQTIPVLLYHGNADYVTRHLYEYLQSQDESLRKYVPQFEYILIDLDTYSDEQIMSMKFGFFLRSVLLLFKHKNDKEYVKRNSGKIFIFVEENIALDQKHLYVRELFFYIIKTFKMDIQEIDEVVENVSDQSRETVMTGYDALIHRGVIQGIERGANFTDLKKEVEIVFKGITNPQKPSLEIIILFSGQSKKFIKKLQDGFADGSEKKARKVLHDIFKKFKPFKTMETEQIEGLLKEFLPKFKKK